RARNPPAPAVVATAPDKGKSQSAGSNIIEIDLNKLPPDLAKRIADLARSNTQKAPTDAPAKAKATEAPTKGKAAPAAPAKGKAVEAPTKGKAPAAPDNGKAVTPPTTG